jgi:hypothetical protein
VHSPGIRNEGYFSWIWKSIHKLCTRRAFKTTWYIRDDWCILKL